MTSTIPFAPRIQTDSTLYALAQKKLDALPAVWISDTESDHGRIEHRELRVAGFDLDASLIPQENFSSLNAAFDHFTENRAEAIRLLTQTPPHCP